MTTIREIFSRPIDRTIEEVIKVEQADEQVVLTEIREYVPTAYLQEQFGRVLDEIASGPSQPREGIGVWISGFFGSGKSLFAKILGYVAAARKVGGRTAAELFKERLDDPRVIALIDSITAHIPFHAVIFDVSMERGVRSASERITEILYKALLRELGYAEDFDLAELEIALEGDGRLDEFREIFQQMFGEPWEKRRLLGLAVNEAGAVLHRMDPATYPTADSYAMAVGRGRANIDANKVARRAFELTERRRPGHALIFVVDEVGQYVSRSVEKMLDLQGLVQALGVEGRNRVERRQAVSPCWLVVTSQEKLDEVVQALDSKKIELARLQDRFRVTVDLKQSDIAEITSRRVLDKTPQAAAALGRLYDENEGRLQEFTRLERTSRDTAIDRDRFIRLYPYLPYQIDLCIDIVAGLRLRRGAHRHVGGSNRTIIKQAQEMMINPRTRLADAPLGTLVTLDKVYELLYLGNLLPSEVSREIDDAARNLAGDDMAVKVLKAIALLEPVKDLPRTPRNLAAVLYPSVTSGSIQAEVERALQVLEKAQLVRNSDEGYKLLTVQEKTWDTRRNAIEPREADRNRIRREVLKEVFAEPKLRAYRYRDLRPFRASLQVEGDTVEADGDIPLRLLVADDPSLRAEKLAEGRDASSHRRDEVFWVITFDDPIHALVTEVYRSREMINEYERLAAQQRLTAEEAACLSEEKNRRDRFYRNLRAAVQAAVQAGTGFFQGVQHDAAALGQGFVEIFHRLFDRVVPVLYPKLEIGVLPLKGDEPEKLLTAANLSGLPPVFHHERPERSLVVKQSGKYVPNLGADLCREILEYLKREHAYGNKVTGKMLEAQFSGIGYGWDRDAVRLGLAVLFRGGAIEVTHQGRRYRSYAEPASRQPFEKVPAFRAASFSPRETLDLRVLAKAAQAYEEITGKDVNIEEGDIAHAFQQVAAADREELRPLVARLQALGVPGVGALADHLAWVEGILQMAPDDCVRTLAGEGKAYLEGRRRARRLAELASEANLEALAAARRIVAEQWPVLQARGPDPELESLASALRDLLDSEGALDQIDKIQEAAHRIADAYAALYRDLYARRRQAYLAALDHVKGLPDWAAYCEDPEVTDESKQALLAPLTARIGPAEEPDLPRGATVCRVSGASVAQMESDLAAVEGVTRDVVRRLLEYLEPPETIARFRVADAVTGRITTEQELDQALAVLREKLAKLLAQGKTVVLE